MSSQEFLRIINEAFVPFLTELGFVLEEPSISGRFFLASFSGSNHSVSVSYEPGDNVHFVMVFTRKNGEISDIDDNTNTPRLTDLNSRYMPVITSEERLENDRLFDSVVSNSKEGGLFLKAAKDLRLVLPKHLQD